MYYWSVQLFFFFFVKQKTAYEMRISDCISDVCSSDLLVGAYGARPSLVISGSMMTVSALLLSRVAADTPIAQLLFTYALFGLGFGMVNAPVTYAAVSGMPGAQAGLAAAVATTSRQVGLALGVAMAGTLVGGGGAGGDGHRSEEHTSELQSLMRISY